MIDLTNVTVLKKSQQNNKKVGYLNRLFCCNLLDLEIEMKIKDLLWQGRKILKLGKIENPGFEAEVILAHLLKKDRVFLYSHDHDQLSDEISADFLQMIDCRAADQPLAYILGFKEFMGLELLVNDQVLIPRPDTECLVEFLIDYLKAFFPEGAKVLDLCTGSGAIGIALKFYHPSIDLTVSDISKEALKVAQKNGQKLIQNDLTLIHSDLFENIAEDQVFDLIVSNPPYIPSAEIKDLQADIYNYEPHLALDGGQTGLLFYQRIIKESLCFLNSAGLLALEIGDGQEAAIKSLFKEMGFKKSQTIRDLAGLSRSVLGFLE